MIRAFLVFSGVVVLLFGYQNCSSGFKAGNQLDELSVSNKSFAITAPSSQVANLGTQIQIPIQITAGADYSGTVKLSVAEPELSVLDPSTAITFSFNPSALTLSQGASASSTLTVSVSTMAPSFNLSMFHVVAVDSSNSTEAAEVSVPLQVKAIYDVYIYGRQNPASAAPENWSVATGATVGFVSHPEGLLFRVTNKDSIIHEVHSGGGPIAHEAGGLNPGGVYATTVAGGSAEEVSQIYCHDHESSAYARTFQFNVPSASGTPPPPPTTATFTQVNNQILKASCVGCHSAGSPAGGVDLSSYASVLNYVKKGDAVNSTLYISVAPPNANMPLNQSPLSSTLVQLLKDWIDGGALNN